MAAEAASAGRRRRGLPSGRPYPDGAAARPWAAPAADAARRGPAVPAVPGSPAAAVARVLGRARRGAAGVAAGPAAGGRVAGGRIGGRVAAGRIGGLAWGAVRRWAGWRRGVAPAVVLAEAAARPWAAPAGVAAGGRGPAVRGGPVDPVVPAAVAAADPGRSRGAGPAEGAARPKGRSTRRRPAGDPTARGAGNRAGAHRPREGRPAAEESAAEPARSPPPTPGSRALEAAAAARSGRGRRRVARSDAVRWENSGGCPWAAVAILLRVPSGRGGPPVPGRTGPRPWERAAGRPGRPGTGEKAIDRALPWFPAIVLRSVASVGGARDRCPGADSVGGRRAPGVRRPRARAAAGPLAPARGLRPRTAAVAA
ncbi:hypothetical protein HDA32_004938 [Spinactinospora alkalitolerans]|uniref:Uncharacterized protein n=1 Tax=Spinactinospora alkalitolerans TaxID=687207 RepID=A0A852U0T4_9ACTN|nr:hypothetical protein [Spinactinospora alkalitolerans]